MNLTCHICHFDKFDLMSKFIRAFIWYTAMEEIRTFLEASTIHGVSYISTTRKFARLFWILVVLTGFSGAGLLIKEAFDNWTENPIKAHMDTRPISELKYPKVTVCPPKNTFTDLNYDLMLAENVTFTEEMKDEMFRAAVEIAEEDVFTMSNLSKLHEKDRFYNWYHGYSLLKLPSYGTLFNRLEYTIDTSATSGLVQTQYYGEKFQKNLVERKLEYNVNITRNPSSNKNLTLHLKIEKLSLKGLAKSSRDYVKVSGLGVLEANQTTVYANFTPPENTLISLIRDVSMDDLLTSKLDVMPGFILTWWYTGAEIEPYPKFEKKELNNDFIR